MNDLHIGEQVVHANRHGVLCYGEVAGFTRGGSVIIRYSDERLEAVLPETVRPYPPREEKQCPD